MKKMFLLMGALALFLVSVATLCALEKAVPKSAVNSPAVTNKLVFHFAVKPAITVDYRRLYNDVASGKEGAPPELVITGPPLEPNIMTVTRFAVLTTPEALTTEEVRQRFSLDGMYPADQLQGIIYAKSGLAEEPGAVAFDGLRVSGDKDQVVGVRYVSRPPTLIEAQTLGRDTLREGKWPAGTRFLAVRRY